MAYIKTVDGELHNVVESREEIEAIIGTLECMEVGMVHLTQNMSITGWKKGVEENRTQTEQVIFMRNNIVKFSN